MGSLLLGLLWKISQQLCCSLSCRISMCLHMPSLHTGGFLTTISHSHSILLLSFLIGIPSSSDLCLLPSSCKILFLYSLISDTKHCVCALIQLGTHGRNTGSKVPLGYPDILVVEWSNFPIRIGKAICRIGVSRL